MLLNALTHILEVKVFINMTKEKLLKVIEETEEMLQDVYNGDLEKHLNSNEDVEDFLAGHIEHLLLIMKKVAKEIK